MKRINVLLLVVFCFSVTIATKGLSATPEHAQANPVARRSSAHGIDAVFVDPPDLGSAKVLITLCRNYKLRRNFDRFQSISVYSESGLHTGSGNLEKCSAGKVCHDTIQLLL